MSWRSIFYALRKSSALAAFSAIGPIALIVYLGEGFSLSVWQGLLAGGLGVLGWMVGLYLVDHPLLSEIDRAWGAVIRSSSRAIGRGISVR